MFMKSAFVKNLANSRSVAAFLANEESLATALFKPVSYTHLDVYKRQPGWTVASLWELFTPGRAEIFMER